MLSGISAPGFKPGIVSLLVNGMIYEGFKKVEVTRSVREMAGQFSLEVSERWTGGNGGPASLMGWRIRPGDPCVVLYSGFPVVTGYVDTYCPKYDSDNHDVSIQGRSKTQDLVDSSADPDVENGEMRNVGLDQMARKLASKHGVGVKVQAKLKGKFDVARVQPGETKHEMLERYARPGAVLLTDDEMGDLRLLHVMGGGGGGALIEGVNILEASATLRADNRYSDYTAKGQDHGNDQRYGREVAEIAASSKDGAVKRYRPLVVNNETKTSQQNAKDRCDWESSSRAGESTKAEVTVVDWVFGGKLWMPGDVVMLISPMLAINRLMAVESVSLSQDEKTIAKLSLVPPEALNPSAGGGGGGAGSGGSGGGGAGGGPGAATNGSAPATDPAWTDVKPTSPAVSESGLPRCGCDGELVMRDALNRSDAHKQEMIVRSLIQRGVVDRVEAGKKMQTLNISLRNGHKPTQVEHWERYGITHNPHEGAEVLAFALGGNPDHIIVTDVADRRHRMTNLKPGELAVHDDQGQSVHFTRDGVVVKSGKGVTIECAAGITLKGPITIEGDISQQGGISSSGAHQAAAHV